MSQQREVSDNFHHQRQAETIAFRATSESTTQVKAAVEFARLLGRLKVTPRTGWVRRGVPKWESVADHSWRVAALSLLLPGDYDVTKCIAMGVLHDVAECVTGDICPGDNVSKQDKTRMEAEATEEIAEVLGQAVCDGDENSDQVSSQKQLTDLLHEYETRESKEAIAVKDLDLLDMLIQAGEYEERFSLDLSEFYSGTPVSRFRTPILRSVAQEVHNRRRNQNKAHQDKKYERNVECICESDAAFIAEYSKASDLSSEQIEQVIKARRAWEKTNNA